MVDDEAASRTAWPDILRVPVADLSMAAVVEVVRTWLVSEDQHLAIGVNAHVVNLARRDSDFAAALAYSSLNYPDGQSIVWAARTLGYTIPERVATTDLVWPLVSMAADEGAGVFLFGGRPGVADRAAERLLAVEPKLVVSGTSHGYIGEHEQDALVDRINDSGARLLFVGLGNPRQEAWALEHMPDLKARAVLTCGGLLDWVAGDVPRPPAWVPKAGLEWGWRLWLEPRRLARRYLIGNPVFVSRLAMEVVRRTARRALTPERIQMR